MDYQALATEIETGPLAAELAATDSIGKVAILNDRRFTMPKSRFITARTLLAELGAEMGASILDKLETAATSISPLKWAMKFLQLDGGLDIGHAQTMTMIDELVTAEVLTAAEGTALKSLGMAPASRAEVIGLGTVTYSDVMIALAQG